FTQSGEGHLLLTVRTDRGDFALDNLRRSIVSVDHAGYRWVARQSTIHPRLWVMIDGFSFAPVMVAKAPVESRPAVAPSGAPIELASAPARGMASSGPHGRRTAPIAAAPATAGVPADEPGPCETAKAPSAFDFRSVFTFFDPTTVGTIPGREAVARSIEAR
ncbi:MAG: transglutaminase-like cysteine peptidase, partial [Hyphomicrobiales bacterium]|nr:transglutaminase-like cysteine peptidase [Hyphomicrobiales bacterium]